MSESSVFGNFFSGHQLEEAVTNTLQKWYPTYLKEAERQYGFQPQTLKIPPLDAYTTRNTFEFLSSEDFPKVVVISPGTVGTSVLTGSKTYRAIWRLGVGIALAADTEEFANQQARATGAATRALILQKSSLDGSIKGIVDVSSDGESYDDIPVQGTKLQLFKSVAMYFMFDIENIVRKYGGPSQPDLDPNRQWPIAETVDVELEKEAIT